MNVLWGTVVTWLNEHLGFQYLVVRFGTGSAKNDSATPIWPLERISGSGHGRLHFDAN